MRNTSRLLALLVASALSVSAFAADAPNADAQKNNANVAVVNGVAIPASKVELQLKALAARGQQDTPDLRNAIKDSLITAEVVSEEAARKGLDKRPEVLAEIDAARQSVIFRAFIQDYLKNNPVSETDMKAEYEKVKAEQSGKEYSVRHILVKDEATAKEVLSALKKGAKFDQLAQKYSNDPGSKAKGGDLGWNVPTNFVKPFGDAMVKLQKGQVTAEAVKSEFGYHIIKLDDIRVAKAPTFEQVKPQLAEFMQRKEVEKMIADLRAKAKIE